MEKQFQKVGYSTHNGVMKIKFTNDKYRERALERAGQQDINLFDLPEPMNKLDAIAWLNEQPKIPSKVKQLIKIMQDELQSVASQGSSDPITWITTQEDVPNGVKKLAQCLKDTETANWLSELKNAPTSVKQLARMMKSVVGAEIRVEEHPIEEATSMEEAAEKPKRGRGRPRTVNVDQHAAA
jgi:hypothetical protein